MRSLRQRFVGVLILSLITVWFTACMPRLTADLSVSSAIANAAIEFPSDAGLLNVKQAPYNAKGDGKTDDTAAIQRALDDNVEQKRPLYLPDGTYLISNTLVWKGSGKRLMLQGESEAGTILKLKNAAAGFTNPNRRKDVISVFQGNTTGQAFYNYIFDLTVDVGAQNPGAVGINFINNNIGGIRNVTIRSSDANKAGARGLLLTKQFVGPGLIRNVTVEGFDQGIRVGGQEYSMTFEKITLKNQRQAGLVNQDNVVAIRGLTSVNTVPAIQNIAGTGSFGMVVLVEGNLSGGAATHVAIDNAVGKVYLRQVTTSGYRAALKEGNRIVSGTSLSEYVSPPVTSLFPSGQGHLKLAITDTPDVAWDSNFANWANVVSYGAIPDDQKDDTAAIQAAIDSGKTTVYFPYGTYEISNTVRVRANVNRLIGNGTVIDLLDPIKSSAKPVFRFETGNQPVVMFERFQAAYINGTVNCTFIEHASSNTVVIRNSGLSGKAYQNTAGAGRLFVEDVSGGFWTFNQQQVWMRQVNPETPGTKMINDGSSLWILGLKTEMAGTAIETRNNGKTEVLGGLLYPTDRVPTNQPAFLINNASLSLSIAESAYTPDARYATFIKETRGNVTKTLADSGLPDRAVYGKLVPLYVGFP